jgi:integrase
MTPLRRRMIEDMRMRNFSPHTVRVYLERVASFAEFFGRSPERIGKADLRTYLLYLVQERHVSWSYYNQALCALRFLYGVTLGRDWLIRSVPFAKLEQRLPVVLSPEEVERFLEAVPGRKYRALLMTAYAAGLRVSEVVALRLEDIDSQRRVIRVRQGKGRKDRFVMLSPRLLAVLRAYWKAARPRPWLFPGPDPCQPLHPRSVHRACREACRAAGLGKHVTVHTLRHNAASRIMPTRVRRVTRDAADRAGSSLSDAA